MTEVRLKTPYFGGERLRKDFDRFVWFFVGVWMVFVITGGRMPWQPIVVSDSNSGAALRQMLFTLGAMLAIRKMVFTGTFHAVMGYHLHMLVLGLIMVGSVSYSNDAVLTVKRSTLYMFGFFLVTCAIHQNPKPATNYLKTTVWVTGTLAWISILAHFAFPKHCTTIEERPGLAGVAGHPNVLGPCLFMAFVLGLGITPAKGRETICIRGLQFGLLLSLLMSNSVTATFAMIVGAGIFVVLTTSSYRAGAIQLAGIGGFIMVQIIGVDTIKSALFAAAGRDESMSGRDTLWADVFNEGMKSPIFGAGYGAFWYEGRGREITGTWNPRQSHNAYIDVFVDVGVVGTLYVIFAAHSKMLTTWFTVAGKRGTQQRKTVAAIVAMGASLCFVGAFGESFLLKMEKYQFFVFAWGMMVLENRDSNGIVDEFQWERDELAAKEAAAATSAKPASTAVETQPARALPA